MADLNSISNQSTQPSRVYFPRVNGPNQSVQNTSTLQQNSTAAVPKTNSFGLEFGIIATVTLKDEKTIKIDKGIVEYFINKIIIERNLDIKKLNPIQLSEIRLEAVKQALLFYAILRQAMIEKNIKSITDFNLANNLVSEQIKKDNKIGEKLLNGCKITYHDPILISDKIQFYESIGKISKKESELLLNSIESIPDSHKDKALLLANYAFLIGSIGQKENGQPLVTENRVQKAKEIFKRAKELNKNDLRISIIEARFYSVWGHYDEALKIYNDVLEKAEKENNAQILQAVAGNLIYLDIMINSELSRNETLQIALKLINAALNPSFGAQWLLKRAIFEERKINKKEDLKNYSEKARNLATRSIKLLGKNSKPHALIELNVAILKWYSQIYILNLLNDLLNILIKFWEERKISEDDKNILKTILNRLFNNKIEEVNEEVQINLLSDKIEIHYSGKIITFYPNKIIIKSEDSTIEISKEDIINLRGSFDSLSVYYCPLITKKAIEASKDAKDIEALLFMT
ncbi:MAG: hypothetical protein QW625_03395 [Candidatus Nanoarchaeia archaeon]